MNINHILIQTSDLSEMAGFLENVAGLTAGNRPPFPYPGTWMYADDKPVIHLVEVGSNSAQADYIGSQNPTSGKLGVGGVVDHIAFEGDDYTQLIARLSEHNLNFVERTVPLSHEYQVFVDGPDGLKLEILFNQNKVPLTQS